MFKVYFERSNGEMIFISNCQTLKQCNDKIAKDIEARSKGNFIPPYYIYNYEGKTVEDSSKITVDVGSHTEFYHITKV